MGSICKVVLWGFLGMLFALMTFFPQGNITGANAFLGGEKPGMLYWTTAGLVLIAIPLICYFIIKYRYQDEIYPPENK